MHRALKWLLFCCSVPFMFFSCGRGMKDGIFEGSGEGRNGPIEVAVLIENGEILGAKITEEHETAELGLAAEDEILQRVVNGEDISKIDAVSGATLTSNAVLEAVAEALNAARGKKKKKIIYQDASCDIVIIGAGGAGLAAATEAANKGAKVIVLEKMGIVGGNTNYATGGINASYTKEQKALGIQDSTDVFFNDTMAGGKNLNDPVLVRRMVDESAATVEWLESDLIGADLSDVGFFGGATNKRIHRPKGGKAIGEHLIPLLYKSAQKQKADVRLNNKVIEILSDDACTKATGVRVATADNEYTIKAKAVIIASGGFGANMQMIEQYKPSLRGFATTNHRGATGDAFDLVKKFDAELIQMEQIQTHPTVATGTGIMITEAVRGNGAILVNRSGRRFVNEMQTRDIISSAILSNPDGKAFLLFDQSVRASLNAIEFYVRQHLVVEGTSLKEVADKIGLPADELSETVEKYNAAVTKKLDSEFGRNAQSMERTLSKPPYYAIWVEPAIHNTMGGIKIDADTHVIAKNGNIVQGLFAAGEVTGGVHGSNRLGGNAVSEICVFGKIAADNALSYIGKKERVKNQGN